MKLYVPNKNETEESREIKATEAQEKKTKTLELESEMSEDNCLVASKARTVQRENAGANSSFCFLAPMECHTLGQEYYTALRV